MVKIDAPEPSGASTRDPGASMTGGKPPRAERVPTPGSARSAWQHRTFRMIYLGAFASNIGTWMQNVVLGALAYSLTHSAVFVGVMMIAQLGPLLIFSTLGGMLADSFDRKKLLIVLTAEQGILSALLGFVAFSDAPSLVLLVVIVALIGIGNALYAPVFSALLPVLVPRADISGAISLNSANMNSSRVIGPAIGSLLYATVGAGWVFELNALSYLAVIIVLVRVVLPPPPDTEKRGWRGLVGGLVVARSNRVVAQCLIVIATFSFLCLPFITQMPTIADRHFGIEAKSSAYGLLYAAFGLGAVIGALSIGTVFATADKSRVSRIAMVTFAVLLTIFGVLRFAPLAYAVVLAVGTSYFAVITSLATVLQENIEDADRGKVMAWWIMGYGGVVPFGGLLGGWLMDATSIEIVTTVGALVAVALALRFDLQPTRVGRPGPPGTSRPSGLLGNQVAAAPATR